MPKAKKRTSRKGKAGRPAERLIITEDPRTALAKLLKPTAPKRGK
jgi:hypothetical protein